MVITFMCSFEHLVNPFLCSVKHMVITFMCPFEHLVKMFLCSFEHLVNTFLCSFEHLVNMLLCYFEHLVNPFLCSDSLRNPGLVMMADEKEDYVMTVDVLFTSNGSLTVSIETHSGQMFNIHYVLTSTLLAIEGSDIYYGLGQQRGHWIHLARDIKIDLQKGKEHQAGETVLQSNLSNTALHCLI